MADPIGIWCAMFAYADREIAAHQFGSRDQIAPFLQARWLAPARPRDAVLCEMCDEPHLADVEIIDSELRGICRRTGAAFPISNQGSLHRVDGDAFAKSLASTLRLEGSARRIRGYERVWTLGDRRLNETRVAFFLSPTLGQMDVATTILDAVAAQARAKPSCLVVTADIDVVRPGQGKGSVVRLRDIATIGADGTLALDDAQLLAEIFPDDITPPKRGRPAAQRGRIHLIMDEAASVGVLIDGSNECIRDLGLKYEQRFKGNRSPARDTFRKAITAWKLLRGI